MYFRQFVDERMGCASYLVGSTEAGLAVVVDPIWDIEPYLQVARQRGLRISQVIDTHTHADHVTGAWRLAQATGAPVGLHESTPAHLPFRPLHDGDTLAVGEVELRILHAPGHRPENISLLVVDKPRAPEPWLILTGDSLFVGDVARPDLTVDPAEGAARLYQTLQERLLPLPDGTEVYPAHVGGSLCGKAMSVKPSSTIGFERRFNRALSWTSEPVFVQQLLTDLPARPPNLEVIVRKNLGELPIRVPAARALTPVELQAIFDHGCVIVDVREPEQFGQGHLPESLNVPLASPQFGTSAAWSVPPEEPIVLVLEREGQWDEAVARLATVGLDGVEGYLAGGIEAWRAAGRALVVLEQISVGRLRQLVENDANDLLVLDIREPSEWAEGHIPRAYHIPFGELPRRSGELPRDRLVAVVCPGGYLSSAAVSLLHGYGLPRLANVAGGMLAWRQAGYQLIADPAAVTSAP